jgi:hypothetical protein
VADEQSPLRFSLCPVGDSVSEYVPFGFAHSGAVVAPDEDEQPPATAVATVAIVATTQPEETRRENARS